MRTIQRVAVLGAGTMGARIAAHFANAGIPSVLLDLTVAAAQKGAETAAKNRPSGFFLDSGAALITTGSFDDDLGLVAECDWIIEAVSENLAIKRTLFQKIDALRKPDAIISTNTSGIPLRNISEGFGASFRKQFLGTHFFNPPRYLHLLELIPGQDTDPELLNFVADFADRRLGKGIVPCKDTANFIANRIGKVFGGTIQKITREDGYTVEEVDAMTGALIGHPNSASFRLVDIVGLDISASVGTNLYNALPDDPWRDRFLVADFQQQMIQKGWLGEKSGQGYYQRVGKEKEIHAIDLKTFEYHTAAKVKIPVENEDLAQRLRVLVAKTDRVGTFLWKLFSDICIYAAEKVPEISDRIVEIDRAMRWGYAHKLGPFERWDALGFEDVCNRLEVEGREIPANIEAMRRAGATSLYQTADSNGKPGTRYFDLVGVQYRDLEERPGIIVISDVKRARGTVKQNAGASLIDLGDGVLCVEFHSRTNTVGEDQVAMLYAGLEETTKNFQAMVIASQGENFSAGTDLLPVLLAAQEGAWDRLSQIVQRLQQMNLALKYAAKPVIASPFSRTVGLACEMSLHATRMQANAETSIGLVDVSVGLIPAAGGCKEMLLRLKDSRQVFELLNTAKISSSGEHAKELGFLIPTDRISMNPERLIGDAKELALSLVNGHTAGAPMTAIKVGGKSMFEMLKLGAASMHAAGTITDYDLLVAEKLAHVLSGGDLAGEQTVSEKYLLDLEREAFLSLCGNPQTQERIQSLLKTGKPARN